MEEKLIRGTDVSKVIRSEIQEHVTKLKKKGFTPGLAVVLVGDNPASKIYVNLKGKACKEVGIFSETIELESSTSQSELIKLIKKLNQDNSYHGILVQSPLPNHIDEQIILETVNPIKDVDCFHPENVGKLVIGKPYVLPCTPAGILELLKAGKISTKGKHAVVLGRSNIVGKPMINLLLQKSSSANATVTVVHTGTVDIPAITRQADILIAAMGNAQFIKSDMIKKGVVIIDVGMNRIPADNERGYRLVGDVDFDSVLPKVHKITPVPGGVGPMTIALLLKNTLTVAEKQYSLT